MKHIVFLCLILSVKTFQPATFPLTTTGYQFQPANDIEILATISPIRSTIRCTILCYRHIQCRTFDFDRITQQCRLFEGSIDTGILLFNSSLSTVVGWINIDSSVYNMYNTTSDNCINNRYLYDDSSSGICQCPIHTFWNGSICVNQKYAGSFCQNNNWCRNDLELNCSSSICAVNATESILSTSSTTTTPTTTTTTTTTSTTGVVAPCTPQVTTGGILYSVLNPTSSIYPNYTCYAYTWVATGSSATLSFSFRHDPGAWMLDDVKVYHGATQIIINGGFESGTLAGWNYTGSCTVLGGQVFSGSTSAKSGNYYYYDGCMSSGDKISQMFATVPGDTYSISFWLINFICCSPTVIANVTLF